MTIDERWEALTMNLQLQARETEVPRKLIAQDAENIRALARIAVIHEKRQA